MSLTAIVFKPRQPLTLMMTPATMGNYKSAATVNDIMLFDRIRLELGILQFFKSRCTSWPQECSYEKLSPLFPTSGDRFGWIFMEFG